MSKIKLIRSILMVVSILMSIACIVFFLLPFISASFDGSNPLNYKVTGFSLAFDFKKNYSYSNAGMLSALIIAFVIALADIVFFAGPYLFEWDKNLNVLYCSVGLCVLIIVEIVLFANTKNLVLDAEMDIINSVTEESLFQLSSGSILCIIFMSFILLFNLANAAYYLFATSDQK